MIHGHEELLTSLLDYAKDKFSLDWDSQQAESFLFAYLERMQLIDLRMALPQEQQAVTSHARGTNRQTTTYVIASFIQHTQETHSSVYGYLERIVQGNMLANAVYLTNPDQPSRGFQRTAVYFDTSFLMFALGHAGQPRKDPCVELLELLYETGADLRCFRHTVDEIQGILEACSVKISSSQLADAHGPSIEYFLTQGFTGSDIELFKNRVEKDLQAMRIQVVDKPPYIYQHVIDERALSDTLAASINYHNEFALIRDVDSVAAIIRLREGRTFHELENCRAVFVTTNSYLVRASAEFFKTEDAGRTVGPCITDHALTNLLWVKKPLEAPDLPRKRIIADCYAAVQPSDQLLNAYFDEIKKQRATGKVTADDVYLLRYSLDAKAALMDVTLGDEGAFSQGTVAEILQLVRARMEADAERAVQAKLKDVGERAQSAEEEVLRLHEADSERQRRIDAKSNIIASLVFRVVEPVTILMLLAVSVVSFFALSLRMSVGWRYLLLVPCLLLNIAYVYGLYYGVTVKGRFRAAETGLAGKIREWLEAVSS